MLFDHEVLAEIAFDLKKLLVELMDKTISSIKVPQRYLDYDHHYNFHDL